MIIGSLYLRAITMRIGCRMRGGPDSPPNMALWLAGVPHVRIGVIAHRAHQTSALHCTPLAYCCNLLNIRRGWNGMAAEHWPWRHRSME
jgi:hypothetical protein